jgi:hypothetical protein
MFRAKLRHGDWVQHKDGRIGAVQNWGIWDMGTGFHRSPNRRESLRHVMPAVQVYIPGEIGLAWWAFMIIASVAAAPTLED